MSRMVVVVALVAGIGGCAGPVEVPADLVLVGGRIVTLDDERPEVTALAARDGLIVEIGDDETVGRWVGTETEVIDLDGRLAVPGFIEGHGHFTGLGRSLMNLNLRDARNWDEVIERVAAAVLESGPGVLIQGRGWHQEKWDRVPNPNVDGLPLHNALSDISPDNPVILSHASGHATFANRRAMEMAGINNTTPDPPGGEIVRNSSGNPIGVFRETAGGMLGPAWEGAAPTDPLDVIRLADQEVLSKGITSLHDAGVGFGTVDLYKEVVDAGESACAAADIRCHRASGRHTRRRAVRARSV